jgi:hypothetical protein
MVLSGDARSAQTTLNPAARRTRTAAAELDLDDIETTTRTYNSAGIWPEGRRCRNQRLNRVQ